jgi:hypothetical protein
VNIDSVTESGNIGEDSKSKKEAKDLYRSENLKDHLHQVFVVFVYVAFYSFTLVFCVRLLHFVLPTCWQWITSEQVQSIDKLFFSGALGSLIGGYFVNKVSR